MTFFFILELNQLSSQKLIKMVTTLKKGISKTDILKILKKVSANKNLKGVNTLKYCGKIQLQKDALELQKELRNEW